MVSNLEDGIFSKTQAYNFLKRLLGIKSQNTVNRKVFELCFREMEGYWIPVESERFIQEVFSDLRIPERNKEYWNLKKKASEKAVIFLNETFSLLEKQLKKVEV